VHSRGREEQTKNRQGGHHSLGSNSVREQLVPTMGLREFEGGSSQWFYKKQGEQEDVGD